MSPTTTRKDQAQDHADKAKDAAGSAVDKVKDAASHAGQVASNMASAAGHAAGNVASAIGRKAEDATASVGSGMQSLGETVREKGPDSGVLGKASHAVAGALEQGGKYLEEKNLSGMADDLTSMIRRNPLPALLVGIGLGFLLASTLRR